jgi:hypothetical protein
VAAAWLHDVLEDTAVTEEELRAQFPAEVVVDAVLALTHAPGEDRDEQGALRPVPGLGGRPQRTLSRPVTTWIGWMPSSAGSSKPSTWA